MRYLPLLFTLSFSSTFALDDLAHNYVANEAALSAGATDPTLAALLIKHHSAYLVGSNYPDTGYVAGANYGEDSHWPSFVDPFVSYLRNTCHAPQTPQQKTHCDQLTAFLMGITTHVQSDIVCHWTYYDLVATHDFGSDSPENHSKAHLAMDVGADYYVLVRKNIHNHAAIWWVPVNDLMNIYTSMLHDKVINDVITRENIIQSNGIYYVATGLNENLTAYAIYNYDANSYVPWAMANFENPDPKIGAFPEMIRRSSDYLKKTWMQIQGTPYSSSKGTQHKVNVSDSNTQTIQQLCNFVIQAIHDGLITITPQEDMQGDVVFTPQSLHYTSENTEKIYFERLNALAQSLLPSQ